MLRAGGYFAWAAQPVYKHEESQQQAWKGTYVFHLELYIYVYLLSRGISFSG